jgi:hypothetical protein
MFCKLDVRKAIIKKVLQDTIDEVIVNNVKNRYKYTLVDDNYTIRITNTEKAKIKNRDQANEIANTLLNTINSHRPDILQVVKVDRDKETAIHLEVYVNPDFIETKFQELPKEQQNDVEVNIIRDIEYFNGDQALYEQELGEDLQGNPIYSDYNRYSNLQELSETHNIKTGRINSELGKITGFEVSKTDLPLAINREEVVELLKNPDENIEAINNYFLTYVVNEIVSKDVYLSTGYNRLLEKSGQKPKLLIVEDNKKQDPFYQYNNVIILGKKQLQNIISQSSLFGIDKLEELFQSVAQEEAIHLFADYLLDKPKIDKIYEEISEKDIIQIKEIYGTNLSKENVVHEYVRMAVQQHVFNKTTEYVKFSLSNEFLSLFADILKQINNFLKRIIGRDTTQKAIQDVINFTNGNFSKELDEAITNRVFTEGQVLQANFNLQQYVNDQGKFGKVVNEITPDLVPFLSEETVKAEQSLKLLIDRLNEKLGVNTSVINKEQAFELTKDTDVPWNGEKAFFFKGNIYIVGIDNMQQDVVMHEMIHPFIRAIRNSNPALFNKLYQEVSDEFLLEMQEEYPEYWDMAQKGNPVPFMEEVITTAMTPYALNEESFPQSKTWVEKVIQAIKDVLQKIFPNAVNLKNLNVNTSFQELSKILLFRNLDISQTLDEITPMYSRETVKELEQIDASKLDGIAQNSLSILIQQLKKISSNKNLSQLKIFFNEEEQQGEIFNLKEALKRVVKLIGVAEQDQAKLRNFTEALLSLSVFSKQFMTHSAEMLDAELPLTEKLNVLRNYTYILKDWQSILKEMDEVVGLKDLPELNKLISETQTNINKTNRVIYKFIEEDGLPNFLSENLDNDFYKQARLKLEERIKKVKEDKKKGRIGADKELERLQELYNKTSVSPQSLLKWLKGEMGDSNYFSMFMESSTSNPNVVVGGFANYFMKQKAKMESFLQQNIQKFHNNISKIGINKNDIRTTFDKVSSKVIKPFLNRETGQLEKREFYQLRNQYQGDWEYVIATYEQRLDEIKEKEGKTPAYYALNKEFQQWKSDYMFTDKTDAYNESKQFWLQSGVHMKAYDLREEALNNLREVQQRKPLTEQEQEDKQRDLKQYIREYQQLTKLTDEFGNPKSEEQQGLIQILKQYQEKFGNLYERKEIKGAFEAALRDKIEELKSIHEENTPEYSKKLNNWVRENIRITLSDEFYQNRQAIIDSIDAILGKTNETRDLQISEVWKEMVDLVKSYRDEDNQPIATDLTTDSLSKIKAGQEKILDIRKRFRDLMNMSEEEETTFIAFSNVLEKGEMLSDKDMETYVKLKERNEIISKNKLSKTDLKKLYALYEQLETLQSKIATPYYVEKLNTFLDRMGMENTNLSDVEDFDFEPLLMINEEDSPELKQSKKEFKEWFELNHIKQFKTVQEGNLFKKVSYYARTYPWNRIIPNEEQTKTKIAEEDYVGLLGLNSKYVNITPGSNFFYISLRPEYKTKKIVGVTTDNRGNWLPKPTQKSASSEQVKYMQGNIGFAKDNRFVDEEYLRMKDENGEYFKLLQEYTRFHLENQKEKPSYARLWMEIPRRRKTRVEYNLDEIKQGAKSWWKTNNWFVKNETPDGFDRGEGNYTPEPETIEESLDEEGFKKTILTDVFGNQVTNIPIKYKHYMAPEDVSMDVIGSLVSYSVSLETNKLQHEVNPIAQSLLDVLSNEDNRIKEVDAVATSFGKKVLNIMPKVKGKNVSNTFKALENFVETHIEGVEKKFEWGVGYDRFANHIMKIGSLSLIAPAAAVKNLISGNIQKTIEGVMGNNMDAASISKAEWAFDTKFLPNMLKDAYSLTKSLETQLMQIIDPEISFTDKIGDVGNASMKRDVVDLKFLMGAQKMGELHIQGTTALSMMYFQQIPYVNNNGEQSYIRYADAWELQDGVITLKQGIDQSWGIGGDNFAQFKMKIQKVNELLQGAYAKENQAEYQRYTNGKLVGFMRRFFAPMLMNRWMKERANYSLADYREGYYQTTLRLAMDMIKSHGKNWEYYTLEEKRNVLKTLAEIGYSMLFLALVSLLGWDDDDEDKYKKLEEMPWIQSYMIYQLLLIKSETETFIPIPGMGIDEMLRLVSTPTVAKNTLTKYYKLFMHLSQAIAQQDEAIYDRKTGIYEKGDYKYVADLYAILGIKNFLLMEEPEVGIKQYMQMQRRY